MSVHDIHDIPSAQALVEAVRDFLERDVLPAVDGRTKFHARVAINVLGMVAREIELGPAQAAAHAAGLERLGVASEVELAALIRDLPDDDPRLPDIAAFVKETVRAKLDVANPAYLPADQTDQIE